MLDMGLARLFYANCEVAGNFLGREPCMSLFKSVGLRDLEAEVRVQGHEAAFNTDKECSYTWVIVSNCLRGALWARTEMLMRMCVL